ncbi:uncharacterized protein TrAtP1_006361 [Trichoderma atroviride]|uniref:Uncharacterized protein n=1 Tax=Hypocrea atroviridis (strain ATCC 20476 / IMI 206040) TaxID=452589 RepID=G9P9F8_HYPAI|nr:uncharacterized protein TRIATDRAFT_322739 [Trichoderma atroviride IMI 206040]EHK40283.1 hypothetical protein TRIATDRAFT_322739 [Trichoderma atroviride IMI 206040]UKZ65166.1 hypothetical protein TrAtP1_006361 [Trichoderma atroviride]
MVSLQPQPSSLSGHGKLTKSRSRIVVKPILKRLHHVHSQHSERNSLDLNRGWDDQPVATTPDVEYGSFDFGSRDLDDLTTENRRNTYGSYAPAPAAGTKAKAKLSLSRDVSFSGELVSPPGLGRANTFSGSHTRSTSAGASTKPTPNRVGSFVHPFQQMPRTSTPPLHSYANSVSSVDGLPQQRDLGGAIAESDGDGDGDEHEPLASPASLCFGQTEPVSPAATATKKLSYSSSLRSNSPNSNSNSKPADRPSLSGSQRSSSDGPSSVKISTTRSNSGPSVQRLTQAVNPSANDASSSSAAAAAVPLLISTTQQKSASNPITSTSPISPFRTSLDVNGFRLRSRSEMDTVSRQEQVREARRKFEAKEREKEEKYAREQIRKRERADAKEAQKTERAQASKRKTSFGHTSTLSSARNSSSVREKNESEPLNGGDRAADEQFQAPSRSKTAKRRTNSLWTAFILWLRTRLLKLARRS